MACKQVEYYHRERLALIAKLGGKCNGCGEADPAKLELADVSVRTWVPNKKSSSARIALYRREADEGKIQLLCTGCNK